MRSLRLFTKLALAGVLFFGSSVSLNGDDKKQNTEPHARWEAAIRRFEKADTDERRPRDAVLFVGSSSIRMWNLKESFPGLPSINHGFGGSQIDNSIHFADRIVWPFKPRVIVFYAGDNDIAAGKSAAQVVQDYATFSTMVHEHLPDTSMVYVAIKPSIARWELSKEMAVANAEIAKRCESDDQRVFLNIWDPMLGDYGTPMKGLFLKDGLHLNAKGYGIWNDLLKIELRKLNVKLDAAPAVAE